MFNDVNNVRNEKLYISSILITPLHKICGKPVINSVYISFFNMLPARKMQIAQKITK